MTKRAYKTISKSSIIQAAKFMFERWRAGEALKVAGKLAANDNEEPRLIV